MKTLTEIILEQQKLEKGMVIRALNDNQLVRIIKPILGSKSDALRTIEEYLPWITAYIFEAPRGNEISIAYTNYDTTQVEDVIKLIAIIKDKFNDVLDNPGDIALIKNLKSSRKWLIIEMPGGKMPVAQYGKNNSYSESGFAPYMKIKIGVLDSIEGYNWYSLDDFESAITKSEIDFDAEKMSDAEKKQNQQKWNDWIPQKDFEKGDKDSIAINKIRRLLGIAGKNDEFDEKLEIVLKAWQKKNNIPDSGKWDNATEEEFIAMLQDTDYENLSTSIENHVAFSKPNLDKILGVVVKKKEKKKDTETKTEETLPFQNTCESNNFRNWVRTKYPQFNDGKDANTELSKTGTKDSDSVKAAWELYGKEYNPLYKSVSDCTLNDRGRKTSTNQGGDADDTFEL